MPVCYLLECAFAENQQTLVRDALTQAFKKSLHLILRKSLYLCCDLLIVLKA